MMRRPASIERRLTLLLGAIALAVSSVAGCTLFWALQREVQRQQITEVAGKLELIEHLIGMQAGPEPSGHLATTLDNILAGHGQLRAWIIGADGRPHYGGPAPRVLRAGPGDEVLLETGDGQRMRGLRVALEAGPFDRAALTVAISTRPGGQFLYTYATALLLVCALWVGVTVALGAWAVRRSVAPLRRLSAQAARIGPGNLAVRLPQPDGDAELHEFVRTFNQLLDRLQAAYQQLEGFNADVAHELRTPLATLISGTEIALGSERSAAELREVLASNLEELESLRALVNDMLFLARADSGELAQDLQPVDMRGEIARVADYYEAALEAAGLALRIEGQGDGAALANPRLLRRAIANLVSNAIKAAPRGSVIRVAYAAEGAGMRISVRNTGPVIAPSALPRIFDRFYRGDGARGGRSAGHGLGLAIVRAVARMHDGRAFAASGAGGTEVGFSIGTRQITET